MWEACREQITLEDLNHGPLVKAANLGFLYTRYILFTNKGILLSHINKKKEGKGPNQEPMFLTLGAQDCTSFLEPLKAEGARRLLGS